MTGVRGTERIGLAGLARLAAVLLAAAALAPGLGTAPLADPDEGRSAAVALAMAQSGDWMVPHLGGVEHLDKPLFFYAAEALAMRVAGPTELAARLPSLLAAWATIALTWWFSATLTGRSTAWLAALAVASAPYTLAFSRIAIFDSLLGLFVLASMFGFYRAIESIHPRRWAALGWAAMALGTLTKGPIALLLPLLVGVIYARLRRRSAALWSPVGPLLFLLLVTPWLVAVERTVPGFLRYALVTETWSRMTSDELARTGPLWYFVPLLVVGCFPWLFLMSGRDASEAKPDAPRPLLFLHLWLWAPFLFFSLSQSKRAQYLVPLVPAVALLAARAWSDSRRPARRVRGLGLAWGLVGTLLIAGALHPDLPFGRAESLADPARRLGLVLGPIALVAGAIAWRSATRAGPAMLALAAPLLTIPILSAPLAATALAPRSARDLAHTIDRVRTPCTRVVAVESFSPSLEFYLGGPVVLAGWSTHYLTSNSIRHYYPAQNESGSPWLRPADWWKTALRDSADPVLFVLRTRRREQLAELEAAGLPRVYEGPTWIVVGPSVAERRPPLDWGFGDRGAASPDCSDERSSPAQRLRRSPG